MNKKTQRSQKRGVNGFTLLEVMMAMAIFSIGILAIAGIQHMIVNGNRDGNIVTQQCMLAQRVMEEYKNNASPSSLSSTDYNNVDEFLEAGGPYNVSVTVMTPKSKISSVSSPVDLDSARFITVEVTKNGPGGHPITIQSITHGNGT